MLVKWSPDVLGPHSINLSVYTALIITSGTSLLCQLGFLIIWNLAKSRGTSSINLAIILAFVHNKLGTINTTTISDINVHFPMKYKRDTRIHFTESLDKLRPAQNGRHQVADDISNCICENVCILILIPLKYVPDHRKWCYFIIASGNGLEPNRRQAITRISGNQILEATHILSLSNNGFNIEAEIKWPPFSRRHFQVDFLEWKCVNFD